MTATNLVIVAEQFVLLQDNTGVISDVDSCLAISIYLVVVYFRERRTSADYSSSLVFHDIVLTDVCCGVKHHNSIVVVVDLVLHDPSVACFKSKDAFTTSFSYFVVQYDRVTRVVSTKSNVCFVVFHDLILFNVSKARLNKKNSLAIVGLNVVVANCGRSKISALYTCNFVLLYGQILFYSGKVVLARANNSASLIF